MTGMPEIIGETRDEMLQPAEERSEESDLRSSEQRPPARVYIDPGTCVSPSRLRLIDFSGEGERAPPGCLDGEGGYSSRRPSGL